MPARITMTIALLLCGLVLADAQKPVGPVAPKVDATVESWEKTLAGLLRADSDETLWERSDAATRSELIQQAERLRREIIQLPVGPVPPVPPPPPTKPEPVPQPAPPPPPIPPPPPPTKQDWELALTRLHNALQEASKTNPGHKLPADAAAEAQKLLDALAKGRRQ